MEYDRFQEILQEEAEKIPEKFYEGLNGGVIISEETKLSPYAQNNDLYIAGQYLHSYQMGKQIVIYYGSMMRLFGYLDDEGMRREIARVLRHELKHHIEGRAGSRSLEKWDEEQIAAYTTVGGTPHLDGEYTVFGEVIEGLEIVDKIAGVETDDHARPLKDVVIQKMVVE